MKLSKEVSAVVPIRISRILVLAFLGFIVFIVGDVVGRIQTNDDCSYILNSREINNKLHRSYQDAVGLLAPIVDEKPIMTQLCEETVVNEQNSNAQCEVNWFANSDSGWVFPDGYCYITYP